MRRTWSEQIRVTLWAWVATVGASIMVAPLVEKKTYLWHGGVGAAVVAGVGAALRARRVPWPVILLAQLAAVTEWCVAVYARSDALFGIVPTKAAFAELANRVATFIDLSNQYAAPVPDDPDLTMTLALFVLVLGLVVDAIAVTWGRVPLLGLVFLAVYMAPVALLGGEVSLFVFIPGAAGFVFLLAADERERLTHWGRQISSAGSVWEDSPKDVSREGIRATGRRIGLGAVAAAVVLPVIIPTLSPHYFGESGSGGGDGSGNGDGTQVDNPVLDLKRNLVGQSDALLIRFSTNQPDPSYLRLASLDVFTGSQWQPGTRQEDTSVSSDSDLPAAPGLDTTVPRTGFSYDIAVEPIFDSTWLPLVYAPTTIDAPQRWRVDETNLDASAVEEDQTTAGTGYGFTAVLVDPTPVTLRNAGPVPAALAPFTALPAGLPDVIAEQARTVTGGETTPFDQALAMQSWFRTGGGFRYSLGTAAGTGMETIESFLTDDRVGYCEQFASAMALMARSLDIPARVAVGFLRPERVATSEYVYRGTDMHAWPELYFEGVGWVRFEPTPATRTGAAPEFTRGADEPLLPTAGAENTPEARPNQVPTQPEDAAAAATSGGDSGSNVRTVIAPVVGGTTLLLVLTLTPRLLRAARLRSRWRRVTNPAEAAEAAWAELRDNVLDLRMDWDSRATPRGMGRQLRSRITPDNPDVVLALNRVVLATEQGRYARVVRDANELRAAVGNITTALAAGRSSRRRWFATWLPASLLNRQRAPSRATSGRSGSGGALLSVAE